MPDGSRKDLYLGRHGSREAKRRYRQLLRELPADEPKSEPLPKVERGQATVAILCASYLQFARQTYRDHLDRPSKEILNIVDAIRPLVERHGDTRVADFSVADLREVQNDMVHGGTLCRSTINQRISKIRRVFRWGVAEGHVPATVWYELKALDALRPGRQKVKESPGRKFLVEDEVIEKTLPFLSPQVAAMVRLQRSTGMRPSEVLGMSMSDIDRSRSVWVYKPRHHKNAWRNQSRTIPLLEKDIEVLQPFLRVDGKPLFSPTEAEEARGKHRADTGTCFTFHSYRRAIVRAAAKAGVPPWSPGQLRHSRITEVYKQRGPQDAQTIAGHRDARSLKHYIDLREEDVIAAARRNA